MINLDRLAGTDLLPYGFAEFVRMWYAKLEENGVIPSGFIDPNNFEPAPSLLPKEVRLFYDLISQGYRIGPNYTKPETKLGGFDNYDRLENVLTFGPRGKFGVYQDNSTLIWCSEIECWEITNPNFIFESFVSHGMYWLSNFEPSLVYVSTKAGILPEVQNLLKCSSPIWSTQHPDTSTKGPQFYWHHEGFLITTSEFDDIYSFFRYDGNYIASSCILSFTSFQDRDKWEQSATFDLTNGQLDRWGISFSDN